MSAPATPAPPGPLREALAEAEVLRALAAALAARLETRTAEAEALRALAAARAGEVGTLRALAAAQAGEIWAQSAEIAAQNLIATRVYRDRDAAVLLAASIAHRGDGGGRAPVRADLPEDARGE